MKKITISAIMILVLTMFITPSIGAATLTTTHDIDISLISQTPDPVEPGSYAEFRFKIENFGSSNMENIEIEMMDDFPFSLERGEERVKFIGTLSARQVDSKAQTFMYKMRVDSNAVVGENTIELRWHSDEDGWIKESFVINIWTEPTLLSLKKVSSNPQMIKPGSTADIKITLWNGAHSFIKDVKVKLGLVQLLQTTTAISYEELPFSPIGSSEEKIISKMESMSEAIVTFKLAASADAEAKIYKVPVTINYMDGKGRTYEQTAIISLIVGDEPDLIVGIDDSEIYKERQVGIIDVKFVNKGLSDVKFLYVKLKPSENYKILSSEDAYIGNIDSDDYETEEFNIYLKKSQNGYATLPLEIEFKDANNVEYQKTIELKLKLLSEEEALLVGMKKSNTTTGIVITLAIIIIGVFIYRRIRKKKK
ncbi:MAG: hypothetical protein U9R34_02320 [Nanoarchaeota archaeon]|nr:hypothetical protein [Nanoarchaeota archaeon]